MCGIGAEGEKMRDIPARADGTRAFISAGETRMSVPGRRKAAVGVRRDFSVVLRMRFSRGEGRGLTASGSTRLRPDRRVMEWGAEAEDVPEREKERRFFPFTSGRPDEPAKGRLFRSLDLCGQIWHVRRKGETMKKLMIASDIHGSALWCGRLLERFEKEGAGTLLLLGDLLYHGPRNDLPEQYAPRKVLEMFNAMREKLLCVRGNCDGEVDQMVLNFPIMAEYAVVLLNGTTVYATHGHHYNEQTPPPFAAGSILLYGHTHVPVCTPHEGFVAMNPGSVSLPKQGSAHGYMTWEAGLFQWKNVESGAVYREYAV